MFKDLIEQIERSLELLEDQIKIGNTGTNAEIYEARNILRQALNELQKNLWLIERKAPY